MTNAGFVPPRHLIEKYVVATSQGQQDLVLAEIAVLANDRQFILPEDVEWAVIADALYGRVAYPNGNGNFIVLEQSGLCSVVADLESGQVVRQTRWVPVEALHLFMVRSQL